MDQLIKARLSRDSVASRLRDVTREIKTLQAEEWELEPQLLGLDGYKQALEEVSAQAAKDAKESQKSAPKRPRVPRARKKEKV